MTPVICPLGTQACVNPKFSAVRLANSCEQIKLWSLVIDKVLPRCFAVLLTDCPSSMSCNAELSRSVCDCVSLSSRMRISVSCIYALKCWWLHVTTITNWKLKRFHLHTNNIRVRFIKNLAEIWLLFSFNWLQIYCELLLLLPLS